MMIPYRVRQVWGRYVLRTGLTAEETAWVRVRLNEAEWALFRSQERADQCHAYQVAHGLAAQGHDDPTLLTAALLHDTGKAPGISLVYRTLLVLARALVGEERLLRLSPATRGLLEPLARAVHHPALGAALACAAGSNERVVALIEHHQDKQSTLPDDLAAMLVTLQAVDDAM